MKLSLKNIFYLFFIGAISSLLILTASTLFFSKKFRENQRYLEQINSIDTSRNEMVNAINNILVRQVITLSARTKENILSLSVRNADEEIFLKGLRSLEKTVKHDPDLPPIIHKLHEIFTRLLTTDQRLESIALSTLVAKDQLNKLVEKVNEEIANLQENSDSISGKLSLEEALNKAKLSKNVSQYLEKKQAQITQAEKQEFKSSVENLLTSRTLGIKTLSIKIEKDLATLSSQTRQLSTETNPDVLVSLKENLLEQQIQLNQRNLLELKDILKTIPAFSDQLTAMTKGFDLIKSQLINDPVNVYALRTTLNNKENELQATILEVKGFMIAIDGESKNLDNIASKLKIALLKKEEKIAFISMVVIFSIAGFLGLLLILGGNYLLRIITGSLNTVMGGMKKITSGKQGEIDLHYRIEKNRVEELNLMIDTFNFMMEKLQFVNEHLEELVSEKTAEIKSIHQELVQSSRQAGMAEVATSVLHNIGNVLNSVGVSISVMNDSLNKPAFNNVGRSLVLLKEHIENIQTYLTEDPKGKLFPLYFIQLLGELEALREQMKKESKSLELHFNHIHEIVNMQSAISGEKSTVTEKLFIPDVVDMAIQLASQGFSEKNIQLKKVIINHPFLTTDKSRVVQIIVNLIQNANDSLMAMNNDQQKLITIQVSENLEEKVVDIAVKDNGLGMTEDTMKRLFKFGFTTRKNGHGFGLHNSSISAKELGGSLIAESEGKDKGAIFTLRLPVNNDSKNLDQNKS